MMQTGKTASQKWVVQLDVDGKIEECIVTAENDRAAHREAKKRASAANTVKVISCNPTGPEHLYIFTFDVKFPTTQPSMHRATIEVFADSYANALHKANQEMQKQVSWSVVCSTERMNITTPTN